MGARPAPRRTLTAALPAAVLAAAAAGGAWLGVRPAAAPFRQAAALIVEAARPGDLVLAADAGVARRLARELPSALAPRAWTATLPAAGRVWYVAAAGRDRADPRIPPDVERLLAAHGVLEAEVVLAGLRAQRWRLQ